MKPILNNQELKEYYAQDSSFKEHRDKQTYPAQIAVQTGKDTPMKELEDGIERSLLKYDVYEIEGSRKVVDASVRSIHIMVNKN